MDKECGCESDGDCGCSCGCGGNGGGFERQYQTKAEQISELEGYLDELKLEVQAVEEHLVDLRK